MLCPITRVMTSANTSMTMKNIRYHASKALAKFLKFLLRGISAKRIVKTIPITGSTHRSPHQKNTPVVTGL